MATDRVQLVASRHGAAAAQGVPVGFKPRDQFRGDLVPLQEAYLPLDPLAFPPLNQAFRP
ncbi:MAG TPA: hypothetical protein VGJ75_18595 [Dongiaceae bacterium]